MFSLELLLPLIVVLGALFFLPIWHWTTKDVAYFDRIGVAHSTWKVLFVIGLFGPMPLVALAWWGFAVGDALRERSRRVSTS